MKLVPIEFGVQLVTVRDPRGLNLDGRRRNRLRIRTELEHLRRISVYKLRNINRTASVVATDDNNNNDRECR